MPKSTVDRVKEGAVQYVSANQETMKKVALGSATAAVVAYPAYTFFNMASCSMNSDDYDQCMEQTYGFLSYVGSWVTQGLMTTASAQLVSNYGPLALAWAQQKVKEVMGKTGMAKSALPGAKDAVSKDSTASVVVDEGEPAASGKKLV